MVIIATTSLWILAVAFPLAVTSCQALVAGAAASAPSPNPAATIPASTIPASTIRDPWFLLARGLAWSVGAALAAVLLGWPAGRALRRERGRGAQVAVAAVAAPIMLPGFLVSWSWWQVATPTGPLGDWLMRIEAVTVAREVALAVGLVAWSWPLVAFSVAGLGAVHAELRDALRVDGGSRLDGLRLSLVEDGRGLLLGALLVMIFTLGNTVAFDLAQVRSFGFELRTLDARGAAPLEVVRESWPVVALTLLLGSVVAAVGRSRTGAPGGVDSTAPTRMGRWILAILVAGSALVPLVLCAWRLPWGSRAGEFLVLYGGALVTTLAAALATGVAAAVVAVGTMAMHLHPRRSIRRLGDLQLAGWFVAAAVPSMVVASSFVAAYNRGPLAAAIYDRAWIVALGHLACFGLAGALLGRLAARGLGRDVRDLIALDCAAGRSSCVSAVRPVAFLVAAAACFSGLALALGEVVVGGRLAPPGTALLASSVLNAIHYQDPETVMFSIVIMIGCALVAAVVCAVALRPLTPRDPNGPRQPPAPFRGARSGGARVLGLILAGALSAGALVLPFGCGGDSDGGQSRLEGPDATGLMPLPRARTFGSGGIGLGQFDAPRAMALDRRRGELFIIDKTARVQRFSADGSAEFEWSMPESKVGKPTGVSVDEAGRVWVADTHYHRVIAFDREGRELLRIGRYGQGPGEFVYPTDVAFGPEGRIYVSEYGGNDRVQAFAADGTYLFGFGRSGTGEREFSRPQSMEFSADRSELFIADSCNHRIVVVDPEGQLLRSFGVAGTAAGQFMYPYGLAVAPDGSLLVVEFGGSRLQRLSADGEPRGAWGGIGSEPGRLRTPWGVVVDSDTIRVLDSGNNRVHSARLEHVGGTAR